MAWTPVAWADTSAPVPSATTHDAQDHGSLTLTVTSPDGDSVPGASFTLLNALGERAGEGTTDAAGHLTFTGLPLGGYRLKETTTGSSAYEPVPDQDVVITPGHTAELTLTSPFAKATVRITAKDATTGKPLGGATFSIGRNSSTLLTVTTNTQGIATGTLGVDSRSGTTVWVKQRTAPTGYAPSTSSKSVTATPGDTVTVTVTNTKTKQPTSSATATAPAATSPAAHQHAPAAYGTHAPRSTSPTTSPSASETTATTQSHGALAHTGTAAAPWLMGGATMLVVAGSATLWTARRRRTNTHN
ncbi:collagen binding domain-containing protein [Streptomyces sp. NPDC050085]|uniref:collagen binding domain-containing protein n=1 Tax=Streptomyces sp. NPDC050085 TaxID=3365600 RepID=UPI003798AE33